MDATQRCKQFRKKPIVVEAVQFTENNGREIYAFAGKSWTWNPLKYEGRIETLEGAHIATVGDWIIKGVKGEFYPCKPDIFAATYEPAEPEPAAPPEGRAPHQFNRIGETNMCADCNFRWTDPIHLVSDPPAAQPVPIVDRYAALHNHNATTCSACIALEASHAALVKALEGVRFNVAYAYQPENCGDHCRNNCRDCVLKNTLDDIDAALVEAAKLGGK